MEIHKAFLIDDLCASFCGCTDVYAGIPLWPLHVHMLLLPPPPIFMCPFSQGQQTEGRHS